MILGLIGSGRIGSTVAKLAVDAGHDVVLSNSRGPETLAGLVAELGCSTTSSSSTC
jgi:8-hydroxy-5-deazaflavin:NADPH oxidoreductase